MINSIRTKKTKKIVDKECLTIDDLLQANVGQDVQILVIDDVTKSKEWMSGKIKSVKRFQQLSDDEDTDAEATTAAITPHIRESSLFSTSSV